MCSHCGFSAKSPVSHMPYPIFLQLIHLFGRNLRSPYTGVSQFYSDSDPIAYRDYVIGADMGDICRYIQTELPQKDSLYATIVSKGVLQKGDDVILAKIFENSSISLSFVDLPGTVVGLILVQKKNCLFIIEVKVPVFLLIRIRLLNLMEQFVNVL